MSPNGQNLTSFNHLVSASDDARRDNDTERAGCFKIDGKLKLFRLNDW
jgi:hypothetical protein